MKGKEKGKGGKKSLAGSDEKKSLTSFWNELTFAFYFTGRFKCPQDLRVKKVSQNFNRV